MDTSGKIQVTQSHMVNNTFTSKYKYHKDSRADLQTYPISKYLALLLPRAFYLAPTHKYKRRAVDIGEYMCQELLKASKTCFPEPSGLC